jgi:hypothetical protein
MYIHPYMVEQLAVLRQRELLEDAARVRLVPRKRSRLQGLARAARRSFARSSAPARTPVVAPINVARSADRVALD